MPMTPKEIKQLLATRGITQSVIARAARVSSTQIHRVVYGRDESPRIRKLIARMLGLSVEEMWPAKSRTSAAA
jgi:lambda repressor-like predicted transcriptional regulator